MTTEADFKRIVQNLLAERFKLTVHREDKEIASESCRGRTQDKGIVATWGSTLRGQI